MKPTRPRLLIAIAVVSASVGWGAATLVDERTNRYLAVPWSAPVLLLLLGIALLVWTRGVRARLAHKPGTKLLPPIVAARSAALAMAASRMGAVVGGFYAGVAIELLRSLDVPVARDRAIAAGLAALCSLLVVFAALWLEHSCRLPDPPVDALGSEHV